MLETEVITRNSYLIRTSRNVVIMRSSLLQRYFCRFHAEHNALNYSVFSVATPQELHYWPSYWQISNVKLAPIAGVKRRQSIISARLSHKPSLHLRMLMLQMASEQMYTWDRCLIGHRYPRSRVGRAAEIDQSRSGCGQ